MLHLIVTLLCARRSCPSLGGSDGGLRIVGEQQQRQVSPPIYNRFAVLCMSFHEIRRCMLRAWGMTWHISCWWGALAHVSESVMCHLHCHPHQGPVLAGFVQVQALLRLYTVLLPHLRAAALRSVPAWARAAAQGYEGVFVEAVADSGDAGALGPATDPGALRALGAGMASRCTAAHQQVV